MKKTFLSLGTLALMLGALTAHAAETHGDLTFENAWARASILKAQKNGVAYFVVKNNGTISDTIVGAATPAAHVVEVHEMVNTDAGMQMREVEKAEVGPGGQLALVPGGLHLMLIDLKQPLVDGETLPLTLTFEKAGKVELKLPIIDARPKRKRPQGEVVTPTIPGK
jgi:copper(I)-binding protein